MAIACHYITERDPTLNGKEELSTLTYLHDKYVLGAEQLDV